MWPSPASMGWYMNVHSSQGGTSKNSQSCLSRLARGNKHSHTFPHRVRDVYLPDNINNRIFQSYSWHFISLTILNMSMIILLSAVFVDLILKFNVFINTDLWHFVCVCYCDVILVYHVNLTGGIFGLQSTTFQRIGFTSAK